MIIRISGKAKTVFKLLELMVKVQGNKTLGELSRESTSSH